MQHLLDEVIDDVAVAAGKAGDEAGGIVATAGACTVSADLLSRSSKAMLGDERRSAIAAASSAAFSLASVRASDQMCTRCTPSMGPSWGSSERQCSTTSAMGPTVGSRKLKLRSFSATRRSG